MLKKFLNHPLNWTRNEYYTYCSVRAEPNYENIFFNIHENSVDGEFESAASIEEGLN